MKNRRTNKILTWFLLLQWLFVQFIAQFPSFVESYYSNGIYPYISYVLRFLFGWISISIGDVFYILVLFYAIRLIISIIRYRYLNVYKLLAQVSIVYFCFHFFWGFNYFRLPLHQNLNLESIEYSTEELNAFTDMLVTQINSLQLQLSENDTTKVVVPYSIKELYAQVDQGYAVLGQQHPSYRYRPVSIKNSLLSLPLTYMGFSGYLNPFTGEAQVNNLNPKVSTPVTSCHEAAHQLGYAAENEANFIGFMAAYMHKDPYFNYGALYMALRYALNDLYRHDQELYKEVVLKLNTGTKKNMREVYEFWSNYQNPFEVYFKSIFNQFLKVNKQTQGIKSYNLMIGMLINYEKQYNLMQSK